MAGFSAADWAKLSNVERVTVCRAYAAEAEELARAQPGSLGDSYMAVARLWLELAAELELDR